MIITLLRKPLEGSVADNTLKHGCGALNIDATRINTSDNLNGGDYAENPTERGGEDMWTSSREADSNCFRRGGAGEYKQPRGRWPANFILTHKEGCEIKGTKRIKEGKKNSDLGGTEREVGLYKDGLKKRAKDHHQGEETVADWDCAEDCPVNDLDQQDNVGASRFFKQFKKDDNMKDMIEYFKTMITPPVEDASVIVTSPTDIDFSAYKKEVFEEGALIPVSEPMVHGVILLGEPTEEQSKQIMDILKPGAHVVMIPEDIGYKGVIALEDCGFEVRDAIFVAEEPNTFQYASKASRSEREVGLDSEGEGRANTHPTVKPIGIMEWCARDIEKGSKVVDPFLGSGTTGIAMSRLGHDFIGIEINPEYAKICEARIRHWMPICTEINSEAGVGRAKPKKGEQLSIFDIFGL